MATAIAGMCGLLTAAAGLAGCAQVDPVTTDLRWNATGVNDANLVVQVADPSDLVQGRGTPGADGELATAAVARLRHDQVKSLPDESGNATPSAATPATPASTSAGGS